MSLNMIELRFLLHPYGNKVVGVTDVGMESSIILDLLSVP